MDIQTCLHLLELESPLTAERVQHAYRRMVKRWHPDQFAHQPAILATAEERLKKINQAYTTLKEYIRDQPEVKFCSEDSPDLARRSSSPIPSPMGQKASNRPQHHERVVKANTGGTVQTPCGCAPSGGHRRSSPKKPLSSFERLLREAGQTGISSANHRSTGARPLSRHHPGRYRRKGLHVEGLTPFSPLQPVRAVSKINPIEGSD
jgi:hypothetical protein